MEWISKAKDEAALMFGRTTRSLDARRARQAAALGLMMLAWAASGGCGYSFRAPYDKSVKTVFVPIFKTQSFTRDIEKDLTRQVQEEIIRRTPYRLVHHPDEADTVLSGTINYASKNLVVEAPTNLPRQLTRTISVSVNWVHNPPTEIEKKRKPTIVSETMNFVPETGETSLTAITAVNQRLAAQIVDMMEKPWYTEADLQ